MALPLKDYIDLAKRRGHSDRYIEEITSYITNLQANNLPVIFSITHLAICLNMRVSSVRKIADLEVEYFDEPKSESHNDPSKERKITEKPYLYFRLRKKNGGTREIMVPNQRLKKIQQWILKYILEKVPLDKVCTGFRKGYSIKENASIHKGAECVLNIDLLRFFDMITRNRVWGLFKQLGYHPSLAYLFADLTTAYHKDIYWNKIKEEGIKELNELGRESSRILPQGAPTSPMISNIICRSLDNRLSKLAEKCNCKYSRYADDITFSGGEKNIPTLKLVTQIIEDEGFFINRDKVRYQYRGKKQYVTGLSVADETKVRVPRAKKREIRQVIHYCLKYGVKSHQEKTGKSKKHFREWLMGNIAFIHSIEPEYAKKLFDRANRIDWAS